MKVTIVPIVTGALDIITKRLLKGLEDLEVGGRVETIQNDSIAENGQNLETSPGDLRRLAVSQTPMKNHQLTVMWKTVKELIIIVIIIWITTDTNGSPNLGQKTRSYSNQQKKKKKKKKELAKLSTLLVQVLFSFSFLTTE